MKILTKLRKSMASAKLGCSEQKLCSYIIVCSTISSGQAEAKIYFQNFIDLSSSFQQI